jgi:hypothetical protein
MYGAARTHEEDYSVWGADVEQMEESEANSVFDLMEREWNCADYMIARRSRPTRLAPSI